VLPPQKVDLTERTVAQRGPKATVDPLRPHGFFLERERSALGLVGDSACILLTNRECPWRCLMCDLWKHTLDHTVPPGAIPAQVDFALSSLGGRPAQVKLYNSGSFFDPGAIPVSDYPAIAGLVGFARNIVVECHPRLVGEKVLRFRDLLSAGLEVAMGLETIHPVVLPRLNKRFIPQHFAEAAVFLLRHGVAVRTFLLVQPPFLGEEESIEWALKSAQFAFACGSSVVTLIPTRAGNGVMDALRKTGEFNPPTVATIERAMDSVLGSCRHQGRVFVDLWNLEQFSSCPACLPLRLKRLETMNFTQETQSPVTCRACEV
jgi:radical SAM enzyme (TIGR01210 family)